MSFQLSDNGDYVYEINADQKIEIVRYQGDEERIEVPDQIGGLQVTVIRNTAFAATGAVEIIVPEGVRTIQDEAFGACDYLQRVELPASLEKLGRGVFMGSEALKDVVFPNGNPDYYVEEGILYHRPDHALVLCPPGLRLTSLTVPEGTEVISAAAFYTNRLIERIKLPLSIKRLETEAFLFTNALKMIELPPYIEEIEPDCFLLVKGLRAEKPFMIYAFPDSVGFRYAVRNQIFVHLLHFILNE